MKIRTSRLILRTWEDSDLEPMLAINQDPKVMEFFPSLQDRETTIRMIQRFMQHYDQHGYTFFAVETKPPRQFIGFVGMMNVNFKAFFTPAIEIGWRIAYQHWGKGYAAEAANVILNKAFTEYQLKEIVSFTTVNNKKSRRVMEKIGMKHNPDEDFNHPNIDVTNPLSRHVLYRIKQPEYFQWKKAIFQQILDFKMLDAIEMLNQDKSFNFNIYVTPSDVAKVLKRYLYDEISPKSLQIWADFIVYREEYTAVQSDIEPSDPKYDELADYYEIMWYVLERISTPFLDGELTHDRIKSYLNELKEQYKISLHQ